MRTIPAVLTTLQSTLDRSSEQSLSRQITRGVIDAIERGQLIGGAALPGSRRMAELLGVHRNTVIAVYRDLVAQGWAYTEAARGTFVTDVSPDPSVQSAARAQKKPAPSFDIPVVDWPRAAPPTGPDLIHMTGGMPDVRLIPADDLARAYRRALRRGGAALLAYNDPRGAPSLRRALAQMLGVRRGVIVSEREVMITRGSQMALDLCARLLLSPGDVVAVEALGYAPAWAALRYGGATLRGLPVDAHGVDVDAFEALLSRERVRAIYLTPHHQYPTMATLSAARRVQLLSLARRHRVAVLEDDYDNEFHYDGAPVLPLASQDHEGAVVYIGTLSKVLAPGLRLGFVVASEPVIEALARLRFTIDRQGDLVTEHAIAEMIEDGELQRHVRRMRGVYSQRREVLFDALRSQLGGCMSFERPAGGLSLWTRVEGVDLARWAEEGLQNRVYFSTGAEYALEKTCVSAIRLGFASLREEEIQEGVRRMRRALDTL